MKRKILLCTLLAATVQLTAQTNDSIVRDTIVIVHPPVYFTVLGVGTEHAQVAAIGNVAADDFSGVQMAGVFNIGRGAVSGVQMAGVINHASDSLTGVQMAGAINTVHGNVRGAQLAGAINATDRNVTGAQLSGGVNVAAGDVQQVQAAGGLNYAHNVHGLQASGGANIASGTVTGMQISGGVNIAHNVKGLQIGVVNFADSADGMMIGVFSFARHGYHKIEIGWNETMPLNFSFHTGSTRFHNVVSFVTDFRQREIIWGFGYGVGSMWPISKRIDLGVQAMSYHISKGEFSTSLSDLWKFSVLTDVHIIKNLSLCAGPTLNVFTTDLNPDGNELPVTGIAPYYFFTQTYSNRWNAKAWIGAQITVRFF